MQDVEKKKGLLSIVVEHFIHPSFRLDADTFFRGRILITSMLIFIAVTTFAYMAVLISPFLATSVFWASLILPPSTLLFVILLAMVQRHGRYLLASVANVLIIFTIIIVGICVSGGPTKSPVVQLLTIPPLTAYFFGGLRWGGITVALSFATLTLLILLHLAGIPFLQTVSSLEQMKLAQHIVIFLNLAIISGMAFIYEYTAAALKLERDAEREKYVFLARTDALTGLANRRNFDAMLKERIELYAAQERPQCFALGCLDLDGFKPINDQYGHAVGDEVLCVIADRLRTCLRTSDFVGRHGGDEFVLLLDLISQPADLQHMAGRLLETIALPIKTSAGIVHVTGSLGFSLFPRDATDDHELMKAADAAMYVAKQQRGRWQLYGKPDDVTATADCPAAPASAAA